MARLEAVFRRIAMEHAVTKSESMSELLVVDNLKISMKQFSVYINNSKILNCEVLRSYNHFQLLL